MADEVTQINGQDFRVLRSGGGDVVALEPIDGTGASIGPAVPARAGQPGAPDSTLPALEPATPPAAPALVEDPAAVTPGPAAPGITPGPATTTPEFPGGATAETVPVTEALPPAEQQTEPIELDSLIGRFYLRDSDDDGGTDTLGLVVGTADLGDGVTALRCAEFPTNRRRWFPQDLSFLDK